MTIEELQAELGEAKSSIEALANKNKELLNEKRKIKAKYEDVDAEHYNKVLDENESLKAKLEKQDKQYKTDIERLSKELSQKDSYLQKTLVEDNLTKTLIEQGLTKEQLAPAIAMLKSEVKLSNEDGNYKAVVGDKNLSEHTAEWVKSQTWLNLGTPDNGVNTGGKSGTGGDENKRYFDQNSEHFSLTKQAEIFKENPDLYKQLKG